MSTLAKRSSQVTVVGLKIVMAVLQDSGPSQSQLSPTLFHETLTEPATEG